MANENTMYYITIDLDNGEFKNLYLNEEEYRAFIDGWMYGNYKFRTEKT